MTKLIAVLTAITHPQIKLIFQSRLPFAISKANALIKSNMSCRVRNGANDAHLFGFSEKVHLLFQMKLHIMPAV
jgi:hypothetical protein